jgi:hypothetical protein
MWVLGRGAVMEHIKFIFFLVFSRYLLLFNKKKKKKKKSQHMDDIENFLNLNTQHLKFFKF